MATVVVLLSGTCDRSSTSVLATVIMASVVSGVISDTEPTNVVLPTPKPPATTIFTDVTTEPPGAPGILLEPSDSTQYPLQQLDVRAALIVVELVDPYQPFGRHVSDQDPGDAQR